MQVVLALVARAGSALPVRAQVEVLVPVEFAVPARTEAVVPSVVPAEFVLPVPSRARAQKQVELAALVVFEQVERVEAPTRGEA